MISKKSRYAKARMFSPDGESFLGIRAREIGPAPGVIEHEIRVGDRLDHLARHYYNNDRLWWRIVDANPEFFYGQSFVATQDISNNLMPVPGVMLSKHLEGSVILIPRLKEG